MNGLLEETNAFHTSFVSKEVHIPKSADRCKYGYPINLRESSVKSDSAKFRAVVRQMTMDYGITV